MKLSIVQISVLLLLPAALALPVPSTDDFEVATVGRRTWFEDIISKLPIPKPTKPSGIVGGIISAVEGTLAGDGDKSQPKPGPGQAATPQPATPKPATPKPPVGAGGNEQAPKGGDHTAPKPPVGAGGNEQAPKGGDHSATASQPATPKPATPKAPAGAGGNQKQKSGDKGQ